MSTTRKAATSTADLQKNIENFIGKFISDNYDKDFATCEKELRDGWTLRAVYYDVDGYGFTDVLLSNHEVEPTLHCGTIKAGGDIPRVAEVCTDMMAVPEKYINTEVIMTFGDDGYVTYCHDAVKGENYVITNYGLTITDCPELEELDMELIEMAVDCHYSLYNLYGVMRFTYGNIPEEIQKAYRSVQ